MNIKWIVNREWRIGRLEIKLQWRSANSTWGRFGGGWNWELGFQLGGTSLIVNLLVASVRFSIADKSK